MYKFSKFLESRLNENTKDRGTLNLDKVLLNFSFTQEYHQPGYHPDLDRGERSDSGVAGTEQHDATYSGEISIPYSIESDGSLKFDINNAQFSDTNFRPNISDLDMVPEGFYDALKAHMFEKLQGE